MEYRKKVGLIVEEVDDFKLFYDSDDGKNHFLNQTAGVIWQLLPDRFEEFAEYRESFKNIFSNDPDVEAGVLEADFNECVESLINEGLIVCVE